MGIVWKNWLKTTAPLIYCKGILKTLSFSVCEIFQFLGTRCCMVKGLPSFSLPIQWWNIKYFSLNLASASTELHRLQTKVPSSIYKWHHSFLITKYFFYRHVITVATWSKINRTPSLTFLKAKPASLISVKMLAYKSLEQGVMPWMPETFKGLFGIIGTLLEKTD